MGENTTLSTKLWVAGVWILIGFFIRNLFAMIGTVLTSLFATRWLGTWFPAGWTMRWYAAARVFGANTFRLFSCVLLPLLLPGVLAALLLVLVRTIAMFELTFLTAWPTSQTLVVALYYAVFASGVRAVQSIDAMAVI
jgi:ABC-type spermidine/putrescine transport system permease subunit II